MISMPVKSPLCTVRSNVWPGEGLLMDRSVGIAVEETAELVLQLADARARLVDEQPGEVLIVQPGAALDRVHEMTLDGIARRKRHVVAALHHARAAAFAEQALDRDGDVEIGIGALGVQVPRTALRLRHRE